MATQIGIVKALIGTVTATAADGSIRNLQVGDSVFVDELISTGTAGAIEIEFADGNVMDLGRDSQALLDNAIFNPEAVAAEPTATADSDADAIQAAILAGADPTQITDATAAGAGTQADGNEGHAPVVIDYLAPQVTPESGFDTTGISVAFPEIIEELQAPIEEVPLVSVSVGVDVEIGTPTPGDEQDDVILIPPGTVIPVGVSAVNIPEGTSDGGSHPVTFLITLSQVSTQPVSMHYQVIAGSASNPDDFFDGNLEGDVIIPAGYLGFTVTVNINEDHLDEGDESFYIQLSDVVGATLINGTATVTIIDDDTTPVAQDDFNAVTEDGGEGLPQTMGNVISGANDAANDPAAQQDTDQDGDALQIVSFSDADETSAPGGTITGEYGELTMNPDGSYTYVLTSNEDPDIQGLSEGETLTDTFSYIVTDTYNAQQTANLTIVINGADDGVTLTGLNGEGAEEYVYEANLPDGSDTDIPALTQGGDFSFVALDGLAILSIGGQDFNLAALNALDGTQEITTPYGTLTLLGFIGDSFGGTVSYQYTLNDNVDNDSQANASDFNYTDSFAVIVTDEDGSTTNDSLDIMIVDDTPQVVADTDNVNEGALLTVDAANGVLADDTSGADNWTVANQGVVGVVASIATDTPIIADLDDPLTLNTGVLGQYGTLTLQADGSYTYQANADVIDGDTTDLVDTFVYTVKDADGDLTSTTLKITLADITGTPADTTGTVYEAGLTMNAPDIPADGTSAGDDSNKVINGALTFTGGFDNVAVQSGSTALGTWSVATDGTFSYELTSVTTDVDLVTETDSFSYTATDDDGNSVVNTVTITIVDDVPMFTIVNDANNDGVVSISAGNEATNYTNVQFADWVYGADGYGSYSLTDNSADGAASINNALSDEDTIVIDLEDGNGFLVAQMTLNADGTDSLETFYREPDIEFLPITASAAKAGGPEGSLLVDLTDLGFDIIVSGSDGDGNPNEFTNPNADDLVNTSNNGWAVKGSQGQTIEEDESITFTFVDDGTTDPTINLYGVKDFKFLTEGYTGGITMASVLVTVTFFDSDTNSIKTDSLNLDLTSGQVVQLTELNWGVLTTDFTNGDDIYSVTIESNEPDGSFRLNGIEVGDESVINPDDLGFDFTLASVTDGDGDTTQQDFAITISGTSGGLEVEAIAGTSGVDNLIGTDGADFIIGGAGDDILTGGLGADQFVWVNGDTGTDTITDFNAGEGDVLNLADLLDPDTTLDIGGANSLDDYLKANFDIGTNTTTIDVYTGGDANAAGTIAQSIVINGDLTDLNTLLTNNNLLVDQ
jgi:VCBS repeat-containing protein